MNLVNNIDARSNIGRLTCIASEVAYVNLTLVYLLS